MRRTVPLVVLTILTALPALGVGALNRGVSGITLEQLFPGAEFDPAVPTPAQATGVEIGERPLRPDEVLAYFRTLAEVSPRATLRVYTRSHEGRPLVNLVVGGEEVIAVLDRFQVEHRERVSDLTRNESKDAEALAGAPAVAYMAYGIHGDELSSVDAAVALAYRLVAGEDDTARALRERLVVVIDPIENPDGRARFLAQTASFAHAEANPDQDDLSHATVWPWGTSLRRWL